MSVNNPVARLLAEHPTLILDGALATELEARGCDLTDPLWSAKVLIENPELIYQIHLDYFNAGAQCAITASYQATPQGFLRRGLDQDQSLALIAKSVQLAQRARRDYLAAHPQAAPLLIAGSVGPYGAYLADGSEYRGDYRLAQDDMIAFHRPRLAALAAAGVDLLACETLPSFTELQALLTLLQEFPTLGAWFAFTLRDSQHLSDGTPLTEVLSELRGNPQVLAIGINCIAWWEIVCACGAAALDAAALRVSLACSCGFGCAFCGGRCSARFFCAVTIFALSARASLGRSGCCCCSAGCAAADSACCTPSGSGLLSGASICAAQLIITAGGGNTTGSSAVCGQ